MYIVTYRKFVGNKSVPHCKKEVAPEELDSFVDALIADMEVLHADVWLPNGQWFGGYVAETLEP